MRTPWGNRRSARHRAGVDPGTAQTEAYRILRSNVLVALAGARSPAVLVTSAYADEGKTSVTANLAASLAAAGQVVGLVDLDLRRPSLHNWFGVSNEHGVSDVLFGRRSVAECLQRVAVNGVGSSAVYFLPTGPAVPQPTELLGTTKAADMLEAVIAAPGAAGGSGAHVDVLLVDTPPVLQVADALVVAGLVGSALLVVQAGSTAAPAVQQATEMLQRHDTHLLGVVLNARNTGMDAGVNGYGYGYGSTGRSGVSAGHRQ